jgi:hypothetical protein
LGSRRASRAGGGSPATLAGSLIDASLMKNVMLYAAGFALGMSAVSACSVLVLDHFDPALGNL